MVTRIIILLALAALAFCAFTVRQRASQPFPDPEDTKAPRFFKEGVEGVEPDVPAEFDVAVELRRVGVRDVLYFTITERHGWYADHLYVEFWYEEQDEGGEWHRVGDPLTYLCHNYLDFGATLVENTTPQFIEFKELNEDFGTSENWRAHIRNYNRVLAPKP